MAIFELLSNIGDQTISVCLLTHYTRSENSKKYERDHSQRSPFFNLIVDLALHSIYMYSDFLELEYRNRFYKIACLYICFRSLAALQEQTKSIIIWKMFLYRNLPLGNLKQKQ